MTMTSTDPYTRLDLMERLIRGIEKFSQTWRDEIDVTGDMRTLRECAKVYASKRHSLSKDELFARLEETYVELLNKRYRIKRISRAGSIYFESAGGNLLRVSDHAGRDAWYRPKEKIRRTIRVDQDNWFMSLDEYTRDIEELEARQ